MRSSPYLSAIALFCTFSLLLPQAAFSQEAIGLIGEIRAKLTVLEDFYADSGPGGGAP
jgi:hypothetical protein